MKTFKKILLVMLTVVAFSAIVLAVGCKKPTPTPTPDPVPEIKDPVITFTVDSSKVKKEYLVTEEFDSTGLVVVAEVDDNGEKSTIKDYALDKSAYDKTKVGAYDIKVSVTYKEKTLTEKFEVKVVNPTFDGLSIALAEGVADTYTLTAENTTAEIDLTKIVVKEIDPRQGTPLAAITDYTVELYKGDTKVEVTDNKAQVGSGAYQIWASKKSAYTDYMRKAFVLVYVVDPIVSIALKDGATVTQNAGTDEMTSTWNFVVAYASGATKEVTVDKTTITNLNTNEVGSGTATVSYKEVDVKGVEAEKTVNVDYTITVKGTVIEKEFTVNGETWALEDKTQLTQSNFTGDNGFVTVVTGETGSANVVYRPGQSGGCIELKNDALKITFTGTGSLLIAARSTSNANKSLIAVKNEAGEYMTAKYSSENVTHGVDTNANVYIVTGADFNEVTFTIPVAGTYTICRPAKVITADGEVSYSSAVRINKIKQTDIIPQQAEKVDHTYSLNLNALADQAKTGEAWTDKMTVTAAMFTGDNEILTFTGASSTDKLNNIRTNSSFTKVTGIEVKDDALTVTFTGTGTISITFSANSGSNTSCVGLKKADGTFVEGVPSDTTNVVAHNNMYSVAGSSTSYTVTFTITEAGTYTIFGGCADHARVVRISGITMVDTH